MVEIGDNKKMSWNGITLFLIALVMLVIGIALVGFYLLRRESDDSPSLSITRGGYIIGNILASISIILFFFGAMMITTGYVE